MNISGCAHSSLRAYPFGAFADMRIVRGTCSSFAHDKNEWDFGMRVTGCVGSSDPEDSQDQIKTIGRYSIRISSS